ncbi:hypothetical protein PV08_06946 [Exophiala spinifera]|uniref:SEC7 domain-containing protein n=1 Tax=Exophiala spinifera TaxID=91928 RepID=A0A0D2B642_9EURO|nr:uncharacterized protein PV08_06946 [Exophiala spinifera]KIW14165.1 hypothetical protein PV08_06946 [Exophiala spinifera]
MSLRTLLSRPVTAAPHRRHSSIIDDASQEGGLVEGRIRADSMQRLSLGFTRSHEETLNPFMAYEPDPTLSRKEPEQHNGLSAAPSALPKSVSTPTTMTSTLKDQSEQEQGVKIDLEDLPLPKPQRLSVLGFRHASDPQLFTRFRKDEHGVTPSNEPAPPKIITTAPTTQEFDEPAKRPKRKLFLRAPSSFRKGMASKHDVQESLREDDHEDGDKVQSTSSKAGMLRENTSFERLPRRKTDVNPMAPPPYGDETSSSLAIPVTRLSDSSRSDDSSGSHHVYAKTTTTHTISTTTTFFKLKRRKKNKGHLFPLPERFTASDSGRTSASYGREDSTSERKSLSPSRKSTTAVRFEAQSSRQDSAHQSPTHSAVAFTNAPFGSPGPAIIRQDSAAWSTHSGHSTPSVTLGPPRTNGRGRSSTMTSLGRSADKFLDTVPQPGSARTSTSTTGRRSFGDLLNLPHRLRQNSAPPVRNSAGNSPGTPGSKSNSLHIPREEHERVYPKREDGDTPASYLEKLEAAVPRGAMATALCKAADEFSRTCLRKYMRGFSYFGESIDMAIRKMLMEVELPKETQQIDRLLAGFADRYYECNPGIFVSTDEAAFIAFSILLLHSDTHNKNNKRKMQKQDYVKNTQQGPVQISSDILDCFYDNICYTPFIHFEDEVAINTHRLATAPKFKKTLIKTKSTESLRGPVDPYTLILDNKLDSLRPPLKDVMDTEDCYSSTGTAGGPEHVDVHKAFVNSAVLQIVSARSRPDAFLSQATITNPVDAQVGLVSFKVAKVGLLWRKDVKKKKAKRPWQEWGAILTDSKLYFFKDVGWVKKLMGQYDAHAKTGSKSGPLIFKPPLSSFEPDALMSMDDAVALIDSSYKRHKNAFTFIKHGGFEEVFLANSEVEMHDWVGKLNYAATFRTAGVRMRGPVSTNYEGRHLLRNDSDFSSKSGETRHKDKKQDVQAAAWEIMFYRRQLINEKISDFDERLAAAQKELDNLLRNARHLLILLPIQQKTREQLVLAAGRMSAKLKWTRVEVWRTKTHRDTLWKDLEHEGVTAFPAPRTPSSLTPQRATPAKTGLSNLGRSATETSHPTLSPISATSSRPSNLADRVKNSENGSIHTAPSTIDLTTEANLNPSSTDLGLTKSESTHDSKSLIHQISITSSHSRDKEQSAKRTEDTEEQVLRDAGLVGVEGAVLQNKRPDTSESERDRVGTITAPAEGAKNSGVRRSLHRSLREAGHLREGIHHHSPSIHRHKKGRDSGSSIAPTDDGTLSLGSEPGELKRGAGSFILHGKKASVITMSSEWQSMSREDRMKLRTAGQETEGAKDSYLAPDNDGDDAIETASSLMRALDDRYGSPISSRRPSIATSTEQFVDAETGETGHQDQRGARGEE